MSHRRGRGQADRITDLPDARRIAATGHRGANHVKDGALTLGETRPAAAGVFAHGAECSPRRSRNQTCVRGVSHLAARPDRAAETCRWAALWFGNSSITCSINRTDERVHSNTRAKTTGVEGRQMTILDTREIQVAPMNKPVVRPGFRPAGARRRPRSNRPGGEPLRYRGS